MTFQSPDFRSSIGGQRARSAARALTASLAAVTLVVSVGPTVNAQSAGSDSSGSLAGSAMDPGSLVPSRSSPFEWCIGALSGSSWSGGLSGGECRVAGVVGHGVADL